MSDTQPDRARHGITDRAAKHFRAGDIGFFFPGVEFMWIMRAGIYSENAILPDRIVIKFFFFEKCDIVNKKVRPGCVLLVVKIGNNAEGRIRPIWMENGSGKLL